MSLNEKLIAIRKPIEYIQKTETGNQGAKYVDPAILIKKIKDGMDKHRVLLIPSLLDPVVTQIPMPTKNNQHAMGFLFTANMKYTFLDTESEEKLEVPWFATGKHSQDPSMAGGGALTYFERYFLLKFFQIPTSKDDPESFGRKTKEPELPKQITIGEDNLNWMVSFCKENGISKPSDKKAFMEHYKFDVYSTPPADFSTIKETITSDYNKV